MRPTTSLLRGVIAAFLAFDCLAGARSADAGTSTARAAPTLQELNNAAYDGVAEAGDPFTVTDGRWEGHPHAAGGSSRSSVTLAPGFLLTGDIDGDSNDDAVVLLAASAGGSGERIYLAVASRAGAGVRNLATVPMGDRIQVRGGRLEGRRIVIDVVQAGPGDAMCCPGDLATRRWELQSGRLREAAAVRTGRVSTATLGGSRWVLREWAWGEAAPGTPAVTLALDRNRLVGSTGCNSYAATVRDGEQPGEVRVGPVISTRRICPPDEMAMEARYLRQLESLRRFRFLAGRLGFAYQLGNAAGLMLFERTG